jgi:hypothetical protein
MLKKFRKNVRNQVDVVGKKNEIVAFIDGTLQSVVMLQLFSQNLHRKEVKSKKGILFNDSICLTFREEGQPGQEGIFG